MHSLPAVCGSALGAALALSLALVPPASGQAVPRSALGDSVRFRHGVHDTAWSHGRLWRNERGCVYVVQEQRWDELASPVVVDLLSQVERLQVLAPTRQGPGAADGAVRWRDLTSSEVRSAMGRCEPRMERQ